MFGEGMLRGVRVVDLTQNVAGPFCSQILGDLGAEVIKVERPGSGDDTREWLAQQVAETSATYLTLNRNKRSVAVDIDTPGGQKVVRELAKGAQVFIHSLKPGSAERRGLGHADLKAVNPDIIYTAISAYGSTGPLAELPGYDPLLQAFTGIMSVTGVEGQEPVRVGVSLIDIGTGLWSALGILAALLRKRDTGQGALIETSLMETGLSWMTIPAAGMFATGAMPRRMGSAMAITAPYELFRTKDGYVFIGAGNDRLFRAVCRGLECPELAQDPRFLTSATRQANRAALHDALVARTQTLTVAEAMERLRRAGAPCSPMNNLGAALADPQVQSVNILMPIPLEGAPEHKVIGLPLRIDGVRAVAPSPPPALGADTAQALAAAGYTEAEIEQLRALGAVG
jgi:crotonobetainyl-CoA:carnitine CoA-transferase CaiB-like acyl-CoA transferase